jgi:hypothetical protein
VAVRIPGVPMTDQTTILLDIYERLGKIEAKLEATDGHESRIQNLEKFEGRVGAYIWLGGSIASGVLFFLWEGIRYGLDKFFHH